ncbi:MAG TPA: zinc ribbon domain-containing protein, partial [Pyrinomonadaceae bacterium]|nr:zinc ribbon domain-containing protein [Pyrinomonadaceae bacterium]
MYCSHCGTSVPADLRFCKNCGERLFADDDADVKPGKMLNYVLLALFLIVVVGLGILVGLIAVLLNNAVNQDAVTTIALVYLAGLFGVCLMLLRQVPKLIDARLKSHQAKYSPPQNVQLYPRTTAQLEDYREPVMSVTDHTTRIFDKVPSKAG